jgi:hypothetical protein
MVMDLLSQGAKPGSLPSWWVGYSVDVDVRSAEWR